MSADAAQVALDLAGELVKFALGGGESLFGGVAGLAVFPSGAESAGGLRGTRCGHAGARFCAGRLGHGDGADTDGVEVLLEGAEVGGVDIPATYPSGRTSADFTRQPQKERNMLALFLHPQADRTCPNRAATVAELIGMLRTQVAADPGHPRAVELVGELAVRSDEFAALWALHDVEEPTRGQMRLTHPQVGELTLDWDAYPIPGNPGPALLVCTAAEGSPDAERLHLLAGRLGAP